MWWKEAVIYQVYPRSFQDSDGDGVGDLRGIQSRLDHLVELGVDGLWLSPIYPSPLADFGYDVSDYRGVDPAYGDLDDFEALLRAAHDRGLKLLMDLVPCHTSIEHPWFREHPDWYIWADGRDGGPPNNWRAVFGGPAWEYDEGRRRWYLHSFYPEQPDLDWRNPQVAEAMAGVIRFWLERGVDGFRLDALQHLVKDAQLRDEPAAGMPFGLPLPDEYSQLEHLYMVNSPDTAAALATLRAAAGDEAFLVGEVYLPAHDVEPYLDHLDAAFAFELYHAPWEAGELRAALEASLAHEAGAAWVLSNHDFPRLPTRVGPQSVRAAAMLLLTLPGPAFIYQGDEIGMHDGPGADPPRDRAGRDPHRHPMQWDASASGGFTSGSSWLPPIDPQRRNVAAQREDPGSLLHLYTRLIELRADLPPGLELRDSPPGVLAYERGPYTVALNTTGAPLAMPSDGPPICETTPGAVQNGALAPHAGAVTAS